MRIKFSNYIDATGYALNTNKDRALCRMGNFRVVNFIVITCISTMSSHRSEMSEPYLGIPFRFKFRFRELCTRTVFHNVNKDIKLICILR